MNFSIINRALIVVSVGLVGCDFAAPKIGTAKGSTSLPSTVQSVNGGNNGNGGNTNPPPPPATSGIQVSISRECLLRESTPLYYEQQAGAIFALHRVLDGNMGMVVTPTEMGWTIAAMTQAQSTSGGFRGILAAATNASHKATGSFARSTYGESNYVSFPELLGPRNVESPSINIPISAESMASIRAHASAMVDQSTGAPNGAVVLVIHGVVNGERRVLTTSTVSSEAPPSSGGMGLMSGTGASAYAFQVSYRVMSGLNNCTEDLPPEMCNVECDSEDSPLVLDLFGDGIKSTTLEEGVRFDIKANGHKGKVAWIAGSTSHGWDDAFLARDLNRNGKIDDGSELFGQATRLAGGGLPANGFVALKDLDSNGDDKFDAKDAAFKEILLWQDKNQNGISESSEMIALAQEVKSIDLEFQATSITDMSGNRILAVSKFQDLRGRVKDIIDIFFQSEQ